MCRPRLIIGSDEFITYGQCATSGHPINPSTDSAENRALQVLESIMRPQTVVTDLDYNLILERIKDSSVN
jgi:hypothetical protein